MNWRECDDDGGPWDDSRICWEEIEEFAGPLYRMWRDKLDEETPTWRAPTRSVYVHKADWMDRLC